MKSVSVAKALAILGLGVLTGCMTLGDRREWCMISRVESGKVGRDVKLKDKYRIISSRVFVTTDKHIYNYLESDLKKMTRTGDGACVFPEFEVMFPHVFTSVAAGRPIVVNMEVADPSPDKSENVYNASNSGWYYNNVFANVSVCDATTGGVMGTERFSFRHGFTNSYCQAGFDVNGRAKWEPTNFDDCQTHRKEQGHNVFRNLYHGIYEGFSAAVVAVLEKYENDGARLPMQGQPPLYVKAVEADVSNGEGTTVDNTAAALGMFMGTMGAINSLNSATRAAHAARTANALNRQLQDAPTVTPQAQVGGLAPAATAGRVCPVCMGSTRCRPCNGRGVIESVANIAATSSSPMRASLAARNAGCKACGGTGNCRACGGTGRR